MAEPDPLGLDERFFIRIAVKNGLITEAAAAEACRVRRDLAARGRPKRISTFLLDLGLLSADEVARIEAAQAATQVLRLDSLYAEIAARFALVSRAALDHALAHQRSRGFKVRLSEVLLERKALRLEGHRRILAELHRVLEEGEAAYAAELGRRPPTAGTAETELSRLRLAVTQSAVPAPSLGPPPTAPPAPSRSSGRLPRAAAPPSSSAPTVPSTTLALPTKSSGRLPRAAPLPAAPPPPASSTAPTVPAETRASARLRAQAAQKPAPPPPPPPPMPRAHDADSRDSDELLLGGEGESSEASGIRELAPLERDVEKDWLGEASLDGFEAPKVERDRKARRPVSEEQLLESAMESFSHLEREEAEAPRRVRAKDLESVERDLREAVPRRGSLGLFIAAAVVAFAVTAGIAARERLFATPGAPSRAAASRGGEARPAPEPTPVDRAPRPVPSSESPSVAPTPPPVDIPSGADLPSVEVVPVPVPPPPDPSARPEPAPAPPPRPPPASPETFNASFHAGQAHELQGRFAEAIDAYRAALAATEAGSARRVMLDARIATCERALKKAGPPSSASETFGDVVTALRASRIDRARALLDSLSTSKEKRVVEAREYVRTIGDVVYVPAGPFLLGSNEPDIRTAFPQQRAETAAFFIDRLEVRNRDYREFVEVGGAPRPSYWTAPGNLYPPEETDNPVTAVTWEDAARYAAWRGKRLPTELEWEKAARGVDGRRFPWGNDLELAHPNVGGTASEEGASSGARPAGSSTGDTSPFGMADAGGNAAEWTSSPFLPYPGGDRSCADFAESLKVIRGGSWRYDPGSARCAVRDRAPAVCPYPEIGFRCVRDIPGCLSELR